MKPGDLIELHCKDGRYCQCEVIGTNDEYKTYTYFPDKTIGLYLDKIVRCNWKVKVLIEEKTYLVHEHLIRKYNDTNSR